MLYRTSKAAQNNVQFHVKFVESYTSLLTSSTSETRCNCYGQACEGDILYCGTTRTMTCHDSKMVAGVAL